MDDPVEVMRLRHLTVLGKCLLMLVMLISITCGGIGWLLSFRWLAPLFDRVTRRRRHPKRSKPLNGTPVTDSGLILAITPGMMADPNELGRALAADMQISAIISRVATPLLPDTPKPAYQAKPMAAGQFAELEYRTAAEPAWTVETMAAYICSLATNRAIAAKAGQAFRASVRVRVPKAIWSDPTFLPVLQKLGLRAKPIEAQDAQGDMVMVEAGMAR